MSLPSSLQAPWQLAQLQALRAQRGHAFLLSGPSGLGQYELALALASSWLCERPTEQGACGECKSCHSLAVRTHPDVCVLMPEALSMALGWPLDEKVQDELDSKKRKPSKDIKVDAAREAVQFTQTTRSGGHTKVVLVYPAERMNVVTANTLLKTLEEPPGEVKFVLATESAAQLLPTIRSRCQSHTMVWPAFDQALDWLQAVCANQGLGGKGWQADDLRVLLAAAGGRPSDVLAQLQLQGAKEAAERWRALPKAVARGEALALQAWTPAQVVAVLQKICHDCQMLAVGAAPRFFPAPALPVGAPLAALTQWSKDLLSSARTAEHPFNAGLMLEALVSQARGALRAKH